MLSLSLSFACQTREMLLSQLPEGLINSVACEQQQQKRFLDFTNSESIALNQSWIWKEEEGEEEDINKRRQWERKNPRNCKRRVLISKATGETTCDGSLLAWSSPCQRVTCLPGICLLYRGRFLPLMDHGQESHRHRATPMAAGMKGRHWHPAWKWPSQQEFCSGTCLTACDAFTLTTPYPHFGCVPAGGQDSMSHICCQLSSCAGNGWVNESLYPKPWKTDNWFERGGEVCEIVYKSSE